jgi:hypothetical protein
MWKDNHPVHRSREMPFRRWLLFPPGPVTGTVMRTPSGLDGGCANWGWILAVPAGPFEASRSKGAVSGAAAFRGGKTLARSVQFL